ncbi:hypothetical protein KC345_g85 [Hortaea werneckii]|nr:hypothetical protein KC345_g85 [Hortaea werneckii]
MICELRYLLRCVVDGLLVAEIEHDWMNFKFVRALLANRIRDAFKFRLAVEEMFYLSVLVLSLIFSAKAFATSLPLVPLVKSGCEAIMRSMLIGKQSSRFHSCRSR